MPMIMRMDMRVRAWKALIKLRPMGGGCGNSHVKMLSPDFLTV